MASGVHVAGVKYQFLREEDKKLVLAKKKDHGALTMQSSKTGAHLHTIINRSRAGRLIYYTQTKLSAGT